MNIGKNIKTLRQAKGLTQKDLAERLNVTPQAVSRWELDVVEPSLDTLKDMCELFNITLDQLMDENLRTKANTDAVTASGQTPIIINVNDLDNKDNKNNSTSDDLELNGKKEPVETLPAIGKCCVCGQYVHAGDCIEKRDRSGLVTYTCNDCLEKQQEANKIEDLKKVRKMRIKAWIYSFLFAAIALAIAIIGVQTNPSSVLAYDVIYCILLPLLTFTTTFTIKMRNNFVGDMWLAIANWGCVKLPGVIFSLDIGGFIFLIVAKIFLFFLGLLLIAASMSFATIVAFFASIIAFPFSVYWAYKKPEKSLHI